MFLFFILLSNKSTAKVILNFLTLVGLTPTIRVNNVHSLLCHLLCTGPTNHTIVVRMGKHIHVNNLGTLLAYKNNGTFVFFNIFFGGGGGDVHFLSLKQMQMSNLKRTLKFILYTLKF